MKEIALNWKSKDFKLLFFHPVINPQESRGLIAEEVTLFTQSGTITKGRQDKRDGDIINSLLAQKWAKVIYSKHQVWQITTERSPIYS